MSLLRANQPRRSASRTIPLSGLAILVATIAGLAVDMPKSGSDSFYEAITRFDKVAMQIHQNYVESIDSRLLIDHAVGGMMQILDPHSVYFEKKQFDELMIQTEGKFGGLGIQISIRDKVLTVMTPIPGTPAERAGIQSGDQILKINGKPTAGITVDAAVGKLRGDPGTEVTITIHRPGEKDLDYKITREIIHVKAVPYYGVFNDTVGYIDLKTFSQDAGPEVEKAVRELLKKNVKSIVLDLRFDPGGLLDQAVEVAGKFLPPKSVVVSTRGRIAGQNREEYVRDEPVLPADMPMIVLVNYASASAAEIVSGAIQDWDRGLIAGDTTFGKGSVQSIIPVDDEHHLKLTTAFYYTPSGRCINKPENGIRAKNEKMEDNEEGDAGEETGKNAGARDTSRKDTTTYKTSKGRIVHGGGGIVPDTIIKQKIPGLLVRSLFFKDAFFSFANTEYLKMKQRHSRIDAGLVIDEPVMADFRAFLDSTHFKFQNPSQTLFDDFKTRSGIVPDTSKDSVGKAARGPLAAEAAPPKWTQEELGAMKKIAGRLDSIMTEENKREFGEEAPEIKRYLKDALLAREFGEDNEIVSRAKLLDDDQFRTALSILADRKAYARLLKPRGK